MKYKFYTLSSETWDAMLAAIQKAQASIYWESYILLDDTPTHRFFDVLQAKARQGVRVKIIADAVGSFRLPPDVAEALTAAGAEVLFFNHVVPWWNVRRFRHWWLCRNHKKILVVDGTVGFIGGVNVGQRFAHWLDLQVELRGLIVRGLVRSFVKSYRRCGGRDPEVLRAVRVPHTKLRIIDHWPRWHERPLQRGYLRHLRHARQRVVIATPYFIPHPWLMRALHRAARRGVRIEVILPKATDWRIVTWANYVFAALAERPGIHFYFTNAMIHAKSLLVDHAEGWVGSHNIDAQSFDFNAESVLVFRRKDMVRDLGRILEQWKENADQFSFTGRRRRWYHRLVEGLFKMVQPIL